MSDDGPKQQTKPLTGPTTFSPKPTGAWEIYSVQRQLPRLNDEAHNYLALVDPKGNIVSEMHGCFTNQFSPWTTAGNYLQVHIVLPNRFLRDKPIIGAPRSVYSGTQADVDAKWNDAYDTVAKALDKNHTLYQGYKPFAARNYNSNSVWGAVQVSNGYMWDDYHFDFKSSQGKVRIAHARKSLNLQ